MMARPSSEPVLDEFGLMAGGGRGRCGPPRGWHVGVDLVEEAARLNRAVPLVAAANHRSDVETRIWRPNLPVIHLASAVQRLLAPGGLKSGCPWQGGASASSTRRILMASPAVCPAEPNAVTLRDPVLPRPLAQHERVIGGGCS
jgi:hypothetical protein